MSNRPNAYSIGGASRTWSPHAAMIAIISLLCIAVVGHDLLRTWEARTRAIEQGRREVENLTWSASQHAEDAFRLAEASLIGLVERVEVDGLGPAQIERLRRLIVLRLAETPVVQALTMVDENGFSMVDGGLITPRINFADREYFQYVRDHPECRSYVGAVVRSRISGKWIIPVSRRINHPDGSFAGIITATIEVGYFRNFYATFMLGQAGAAALWREDGVLLVRHSLVTPAVAGSSDTNSPIHYLFPTPVSGTFNIVSPVDGVTRILGYRRLADYPLVVAVALGADEQLAGWRADAAEHLFAAVCIAVLLGIIGIRLAKQARIRAEAEQANNRASAGINESLTRLSRHLARARDQAIRASKAKSRFLAGMSHELRTPLSGILGYARLLRMEGGLSPVQEARVDAMLGAGEHLLEMITCVLDLSEIEAEHVELQAVAFDVREVAAACLHLVDPSAAAKGLGLSISMAPGTPRELISDPTRFRQVLLNLLGNAVKFTSHGAIAVRLQSAADSDRFRIEVADTGPGIPVEQRRRLFQDFERLDTEATRKAEGAGLGLALSSRLATLMGGCLGYKENPGGGSVFWLELPTGPALAPEDLALKGLTPEGLTPELEAEAEAEAEAASAPVFAAAAIGTQALPPSARVLRVLVADDVLMNRDIASSFLRAAGHLPTCVENGLEAVAAVTTTDFDVALIDVRMPKMGGLEATRRIRALDGPRAHLPIVAMTAQAFTDQVNECRNAGMDSHLSKPFDIDAMLAAMAEAMDVRQRSDAGSQFAGRPATSPTDPAIPSVEQPLPILNPAVFQLTASFLTPEAVTSAMRTVDLLGRSVLLRLRESQPHVPAGIELIDAAHALAGSAGMFGFERVAAIARNYERAAQSGAAETAAIADKLCAAVEATLQEIGRRCVS